MRGFPHQAHAGCGRIPFMPINGLRPDMKRKNGESVPAAVRIGSLSVPRCLCIGQGVTFVKLMLSDGMAMYLCACRCRDPEPSILGNQRGQGEYAEDAPKLARRISPSRHIYRNAAIRTAQCLRRRVPDYFLKLRAAYPCFGHVHILHGEKGFGGEHTQNFNGWGKITLFARSAGKCVIGKPEKP